MFQQNSMFRFYTSLKKGIVAADPQIIEIGYDYKPSISIVRILPRIYPLVPINGPAFFVLKDDHILHNTERVHHILHTGIGNNAERCHHLFRTTVDRSTMVSLVFQPANIIRSKWLYSSLLHRMRKSNIIITPTQQEKISMTFFMPRKIRLIRVQIEIRIILLVYHSVLAYRFKFALGFFIFGSRVPIESSQS